uniref:OFD1 centriole and centriolar satellite protein n=1 Tax=Periophthalmus magnuspinnatus TaxID=409849 RepID=A0A3B3ZNB6_9GOBI
TQSSCTLFFEKMKMIDMEYDNHTSRGNAFFTLQSKLESYKKEIEERLQDEMKIKLQHFKDVELAKVQMAEKAKFNKEIVKLKHELEETYEMKTKALMEREKNAIARLQKQQEIEEKNVYMQRQEVLKEIEAVRNRESELRIKMEAFEKNCQIHEEKVKTTVELLRRREVAVKTLEDTHDQRLRNELSRYQLELKEEFVKRTEKLTENETRNKMSKYLVRTISISEQTELDMAQQQQTILTEQKELLKEKLETMSNYTSLQSERAELQSQLRLLGKQLEEAMEMNSHLRDNSLSVVFSILMVVGCSRTYVVFIFPSSFFFLSFPLISPLMAALENEVLRNPKPSLVDRSILEICSDHLVPPDIYVDRTVLKTTAHYDLSKADGSLQGHTWGNTLESDMDLIADAKARMLELQREAETIEEAYRNYQQRAVVSNISDMLIPRPLSPQYPAPHPDSPLRRRPHRLLSPKATRTPPLTSYDTRKPSESQTKLSMIILLLTLITHFNKKNGGVTLNTNILSFALHQFFTHDSCPTAIKIYIYIFIFFFTQYLQSSRKFSVAEQEDDKEQKWKRERKEREEQRLREQEEARERELQELERLEKEHVTLLIKPCNKTFNYSICNKILFFQLLQEEDQPPSKEEVINTENSERQEEQEK